MLNMFISSKLVVVTVAIDLQYRNKPYSYNYVCWHHCYSLVNTYYTLIFAYSCSRWAHKDIYWWWLTTAAHLHDCCCSFHNEIHDYLHLINLYQFRIYLSISVIYTNVACHTSPWGLFLSLPPYNNTPSPTRTAVCAALLGLDRLASVDHWNERELNADVSFSSKRFSRRPPWTKRVCPITTAYSHINHPYTIHISTRITNKGTRTYIHHKTT